MELKSQPSENLWITDFLWRNNLILRTSFSVILLFCCICNCQILSMWEKLSTLLGHQNFLSHSCIVSPAGDCLKYVKYDICLKIENNGKLTLHLTQIYAFSFDGLDLWLSLKKDKLLFSMVCNLIFEYILYAVTNSVFLDASRNCWLFHIKDYDTVGENVKMSYGKNMFKFSN